MRFFDPKEEVLYMTVTSYGKHLLSRGQFDPEYYSFFDDDILYSEEWTTQEESLERQNEIEGRIQEQTPRLRQPAAYTGIETTVNSNTSIIREAIHDEYGTYYPPFSIQDTIQSKIYNQEILQASGDQYEFLTMPIGTSDLSSDFYPAWNASMIAGEISSSSNHLAIPKKGGTRLEQIPQVNIRLTYKTYVDVIQSDASGDTVLQNNASSIAAAADTFPLPSSVPSLEVDGEIMPSGFSNISSEIFPDGTYLAVMDGRVILDIVEKNTQFKKENFEIQVFLSSSTVSDPSGAPKVIYFADSNLDLFQADDVEKYLIIRTDKEIKDARVSGQPFQDLTKFKTDASVSNVISTREFLIRDLYMPEPDICE